MILKYDYPISSKINIPINENNLYDIYLSNILKDYKKVEWKGSITFDNLKEIEINDYIFLDIPKLLQIIPNIYKGNLTSKKLFKIFNLVLIDKKLKNISDIKKLLYENINYKKYLKWICDSKSVIYYSEDILNNYLSLLN